MNPKARRVVGAWLFACITILLGIPSTASALPLISEVFYDAVGSDDGQSFVELSGAPGTDLSGLTIEGINGTGGGVTVSIALSGVIPADGIFVLADTFSGGGTAVLDADALAAFDFQNGPDSVVLRDGPTIIDALGYGVFDVGEIFAGRRRGRARRERGVEPGTGLREHRHRRQRLRLRSAGQPDARRGHVPSSARAGRGAARGDRFGVARGVEAPSASDRSRAALTRG